MFSSDQILIVQSSLALNSTFERITCFTLYLNIQIFYIFLSQSLPENREFHEVIFCIGFGSLSLCC